MVPYSRRVLSVAVLAAFSGFGAYAQSVISAHSGVLHVSEGAVYADNQLVNQKYGTFPDLKEKSVLRTEAGRAEVLLTPGVFLRVGENSEIKMIDNRLADTRVELLKGSAVVECDDPMKENAVTIIYGDFQVHVRKSAVMEFVSNPAELKVIHGEAEVELNGTIAIVKSGKALPFTQAMAQERFDAKTSGDELTRWSQERSEAVAVANVSAAKSLRDSGGLLSSGLLSGSGMNGYGYGNGYGRWVYNPYYAMYTYLPMNGMFFNPYGYGFFSPYSVYQVYNNPGYFYGGGGGGSYTGTPTSTSNRPRPISTATAGTPRTAQTGGYGLGRNGGTVNQAGFGNTNSLGVSNGLSSVAAPVSSMGSSMGSASSAGGGSAARGGGSAGRGK